MDLQTLLCDLAMGDTELISGRVQLTFEDPKGEITGKGVLSASSSTRPKLKVNIEDFKAEAPYGNNLVAFLDGKADTNESGHTVFHIGGEERRFTSLSFESELGNFSASTGLVSNYGYKLSDVNDVLFEIIIVDLAFTPLHRGQAHYWLAALIGPFQELTIGGASDHVLALPGRQIYRFTANNHFCAIQPLNFEGEQNYGPYDAIAFGDLGESTVDPDPLCLAPSMLLNALSFAVGAEVHMPLIETRDLEGKLVQRFFLYRGRDSRQGRQTFSVLDSSSPNSGLGAFLESLFSADEIIKRRVLVPLNLVRSGDPLRNGNVEDSITDLVKALDNLVRRHNLVQCDLLGSISPEQRDKVRLILKSARDALRSLIDLTAASQSAQDVNALVRIRGRLDNVSTTDSDFGIAVRRLLDQYGLADAEILDAYYLSTHQITYGEVLSAARGQVIHEGHLGKLDRAQLRAWFDFARHLHDLCRRLILKEISYRGTYQASTVAWRGTFDVNRIRRGMDYKALGFSCQPPRFPVPA